MSEVDAPKLLKVSSSYCFTDDWIAKCNFTVEISVLMLLLLLDSWRIFNPEVSNIQADHRSNSLENYSGLTVSLYKTGYSAGLTYV